MRALALALALLTASLAGAADIYRWTDAQGNVHFADAPPADVKSERLRMDSKPTNPATVAAQEEQLSMRIREADELAQIKDESARKAKAESDAHAADCKAAHDRYDAIQYSRKFSRTDADGKETWVSGADALKVKDEARADMQKACGE